MSRIPATDGHDHTWVHLFVDEQALGEPAAEIVGADLLEVHITSRLSRPGSCPSNHSPDPRLLQIDKGVFRCDVVFVLVALQVPFDVVGEVGIARPPAVACRVLPGLDTKPVLSTVGLLDIDRPDLRDLEGAQADERTELNNKVVPLAVRRPPEVLDLAVGQPDLVLIAFRGFYTHYD